MTRSAKLLSGLACLPIMLVVAGLTTRQAQAQFCCAGDPPVDVTFFAILYEGDPNLNFSNSSTNSNVGIGVGGGFVGSGAGTITGAVEFAATSGLFSPNTIVVTGGATFGNANVQTNLNRLDVISQTLGAERGTLLNISAGGSIDASRGLPDGNGNQVFTANVDESFQAGTTFTINGTPDQFVVVNIPSVPENEGFVALDGSIVLTGIPSDHVLFNLFGGDFETHMGGDDLSIDTANGMTMGIFLDPNGAFQLSNTTLNGRIFGGDALDSGVINSTITAPPPFQTPEPTSLALLSAGLIGFSIIRRRHRRPVGLS